MTFADFCFEKECVEMLVLTRKANQKIEIAGGFKNGGVTVQILKTASGSVRIGIEAPRDCEIVREELESKRKERVA